jgi:short-subunit dehydrogenase
MRLDGKRVLLTGASSGIGRELARVMAARGAVMALAARRRELLEELADEIAAGGSTRPIPLVADLSRRGGATALGQRAISELGGVDVLTNNAASNLHGFPSQVGDRDEGRELFETNFWSQMALISAVLPSMRAQGSGTIVNVTSMAYVAPFPALGIYCASKAAFAVATQALRLELQRSGIGVLEVIPGTVDTASLHENRLLPGADKWIDRARPIKPEKIARAIVKAIEREKSRLIYPGRLSPGYEIPLLSRIYSRSVAKYADPEKTPVRRTGVLDEPSTEG